MGQLVPRRLLNDTPDGTDIGSRPEAQRVPSESGAPDTVGFLWRGFRGVGALCVY